MPSESQESSELAAVETADMSEEEEIEPVGDVEQVHYCGSTEPSTSMSLEAAAA